jgi:hypothetical protein
MNILKGILSIAPSVISLFKKETPSKGNELAKNSAKSIGIGASILAVVAALPEAVGQIEQTIYALVALVGAITTLLGAIGSIAGKSRAI